jgi:aspartate racemase
MGLVALPPERQDAYLNALARIRAGERGGTLRNDLAGFAGELAAAGAEIVVVGSVEAMLVLRPEDIRLEVVDPGELLARRCAAVCLGLEPAPAAPES